MKPLIKNSRQAIKILVLVIVLKVFLPPEISAQNQEKYKNCIYAKKSNILSPDSLQGDNKLIFWHFVELTHKQAEELKPLEIKAEFKKIGIITDERNRFVKAYSFFDCSIISHKKSCEQWQSFKDLAPN